MTASTGAERAETNATTELKSSLKKLQAQSLDPFALKAFHDAAKLVLVDQTPFVLTSRQMNALNQALDAPGRDLPGLQRLFSKASVLA